jgi:EAL domain-containing protein (putative c-di-GMP-specific phosphodiesterase class I)
VEIASWSTGVCLPRARASSRMAQSERVQRALKREQLELHWQPILNLQSNEVSQYELFLRLRTDDGSLLPPSAFLGIAERFGTILAIDSWVVQRAASLIAAHAQAGRPLTLNLNISPVSLRGPELMSVIDQALADVQINPASLVFELTETAAIGNIERVKEFTTHLHSRGCQFALDDVGSGFGSFYYLKHLPVDYLKIDSDYIRGVGAAEADQLVVDAIVGVAKGMGKRTVAKGVVDQNMTDRLRSSGIDYAQGLHIGAPGPIGQMVASP